MCACAVGVIVLAVCWQLDAFVIYHAGSDVPDTFASIDHPFHVARAEALRRSLLDGEILRWVGNHQGGYPAEFYPFGFAYVVVALWFALLGLVPLPVVHKVAVVLLFVAPGATYWWMARRDGLPPIVALVAFALHVGIAGGPWHGGSNELIAMGLSPNIAAAALALLSFVAMDAALRDQRHRAIAWAALAGAAALWCNPRSATALIASSAGVWAATVAARRSGSGTRVLMPIVLVLVTILLLAAPEILSLLRFGHLYHFIKYTSYGSALEYLHASVDAVSGPVFALSAAAIVATLLSPRARPLTTAAVVTLLVYAGITLAFSFVPYAGELVPQLETTRMMPFQRLLAMYLAATGMYVLGQATTAGLAVPPRTVQRAELAAIALILAGSFAATASLPRLERTALPSMSSLEAAVGLGAQRSHPDTAVLVVGSASSTHQQLWSGVVTDRPLFYDNWMWYWHTRHFGPYDSRKTSWYDPRRTAQLFTREYLRRHGIGAVIATGASREIAAASPDLRRIGDGVYTPYLVTEPTPIITIGPRRLPDVSTITNHVISVESQNASGGLIVRRNWFPRWRAVVNGRPAPVERTEDGYMHVPLPRGPVTVSLHYDVDAADWAARAAAVLGLFAVGSLLTRRSP